MMMLDATSVLCVPLSDGEHNYGTLTLARNASEGHFEMADLGVVEELGEQLALAIRVDRMFRRHTEIADALQSSLLPRQLPLTSARQQPASTSRASIPEPGSPIAASSRRR